MPHHPDLGAHRLEPLTGFHLRPGVPRELGEAGEEVERNLQRKADGSCVFLEGNVCGVYDARPDNCRNYPHLVRGNGSIASRMWEFVDRATYCPIVYNAMEAFKDELRFRR